MNPLIYGLFGLFIVVSNQIAHDWKEKPKEGPMSASHEEVKGANGPEEPNET